MGGKAGAGVAVQPASITEAGSLVTPLAAEVQLTGVRLHEPSEVPFGFREEFRPASELGPLSHLARRGKLDYFMPKLPKDARILDLGCADNWFKRSVGERGWKNVVGVDLFPPADFVGDVRKWQNLGLDPHSFDAVIAFEVLEHGDFADAIWDLLKPDGLLFATTPIPRMDPVCRVLEAFHLLQRRSSPHSNLLDLRNLRRFEVCERRIKALVSQWAVLSPLSVRTHVH
jgi:SAM-dependent methyltransferase